MHRPLRSQILRLAACALMAAAVLLLGSHGSAWATSSQSPGYQTVPTRTPGGAPNPTNTATPRPTSRPRSTRTPTRTPTSTPAPGAAATPTSTPVPGSVTQPVTTPVGPGSDFTLGNGPWWVVVTGDDFAFGGRIEIAPGPSGINPAIGQFIIGGAIAVNFYDSNGNLVEHPTFANPIVLCRAFTASELALVGNNRAQLSIQYFDTATSSWVLVPGAADATANQICVSLSHLTTFGLMGKVGSAANPPGNAGQSPAIPASLPNTGGQSEPVVPAWLWAVIGLLIGAGVALAVRQRLGDSSE